jgi:hypothetical protein
LLQGVFKKFDVSDHRFTLKRNLYLSVIAKHLLECELVADVKFSYLHGNGFMPVLLLSPAS